MLPADFIVKKNNVFKAQESKDFLHLGEKLHFAIH